MDHDSPPSPTAKTGVGWEHVRAMRARGFFPLRGKLSRTEQLARDRAASAASSVMSESESELEIDLSKPPSSGPHRDSISNAPVQVAWRARKDTVFRLHPRTNSDDGGASGGGGALLGRSRSLSELVKTRQRQFSGSSVTDSHERQDQHNRDLYAEVKQEDQVRKRAISVGSAVAADSSSSSSPASSAEVLHGDVTPKYEGFEQVRRMRRASLARRASQLRNPERSPSPPLAGGHNDNTPRGRRRGGRGRRRQKRRSTEGMKQVAGGVTSGAAAMLRDSVQALMRDSLEAPSSTLSPTASSLRTYPDPAQEISRGLPLVHAICTIDDSDSLKILLDGDEERMQRLHKERHQQQEEDIGKHNAKGEQEEEEVEEKGLQQPQRRRGGNKAAAAAAERNASSAVNLLDAAGRTPLHAAARTGSIDCLRLLLESNKIIDASHRARDGSTPLYAAALAAAAELPPSMDQDHEPPEEANNNMTLLNTDEGQLGSGDGGIMLVEGSADFLKRAGTAGGGASSGSSSSSSSGSLSATECLVELLASRLITPAGLETTAQMCRDHIAASKAAQNTIATAGDGTTRRPPLPGAEGCAFALPIIEAELAGRRQWCAYCLRTSSGYDLTLCGRCRQVGFCSREHERLGRQEGTHTLKDCACLAAAAVWARGRDSHIRSVAKRNADAAAKHDEAHRQAMRRAQIRGP